MITNLYVKEEANGEITFKPYDITKAKICGKSIEEIMDILNGLDMEKQYNLEMTMKNLKKWAETYHKEHNDRLNETTAKFLYKEE